MEQCFDINHTGNNLDGCTDLNDLMDILSAYGICVEPDPAATVNDGEACDYKCCPGHGCCSTGMYWDWELEQCFDINPTDTNLDGCTDLNDLMDILSAYGICVEPDCAGTWGGNNVLDECGVCGGDNSSCTDCEGVPNGDAVVDNCGTCDNDPENDCTQDCAGVFGGDSVNDECGTCDNDPSNDCIQDCAGTWGGNEVLDECGICKGPGAVYECGCSDIPEGECDCNGNVLDAVGECGGECELDENEDGVCDTLEIYGCMDAPRKCECGLRELH